MSLATMGPLKKSLLVVRESAAELFDYCLVEGWFATPIFCFCFVMFFLTGNASWLADE